MLFFGEINLRIGGSGYAVTKMGVNLPAMMIHYLSGEKYEGLPHTLHPETRAIFVNERMCIDDWYQGYMTTRECRRMIDLSEISFVRDKIDPMPQQALERNMVRLSFRRIIRKFVYSLYKQ